MSNALELYKLPKKCLLQEVFGELEAKIGFRRQSANFFFFFLSFFTTLIVENSNIYARIYFIFPKNVLKRT